MNVKKLKSAIGIVVTWALSFMLMAGFYIQCIFLPFFRGTEYHGRLLYTMYLLALFSGDGVSSMGHPAGNPLAIRHTISLL